MEISVAVKNLSLINLNFGKKLLTSKSSLIKILLLNRNLQMMRKVPLDKLFEKKILINFHLKKFYRGLIKVLP